MRERNLIRGGMAFQLSHADGAVPALPEAPKMNLEAGRTEAGD